MVEVFGHRAPHQLIDGAGHFAARGAASNHHNGLQKGPLFAVGGLLGLLEGHQQPAANLFGVLEDLHRRGNAAPVVMAKEAAARSGRQDQVVIGHGLAIEDDLLGLGLDLADLTQQHLHIALGPHQLAQWRGHIAAGDQASRHLIQQRLEQVEVALIDQRDAHIGAFEGFASLDAGKSTTNDHHMGLAAQLLHRRLEFKKETLTGGSHRPC